MKKFALASTIFLSIAACQRDTVTVYRAPKDQPPPQPAMPMDDVHAGVRAGAGPSQEMPPLPAANRPHDHGHAEIEWKTPKGWTEKPASDMRAGSFAAAGKNGQPVDISIIRLDGDAGGDLANINRWRGQIGLGPLSQAELEKNSRRITPAGRRMLYVNYASEDNLVDGKFKKRLVAAIYFAAGQSWFFKMTGEDAAVQEQDKNFFALLESLKIAHE